jgi:hypothetical protein
VSRGAGAPAIALLLRLVDHGYERKAWHGPNLRGSLRGLDPPAAAWRPAPGRHNIWEIALHAAYWKYAVRRRLLADKRGAFPVKGSNWFRRPEMETESAWRADLALLDTMHRRMREAIAALSPGDLARPTPGASVNVGDLILGIAAHDVYHAGQIQVLQRLRASAQA